MKNTYSINILANLAGKIWTALATIIFVPIYLRLLGEESYGLITFFTTLQTLMNLLSLGLLKTLRREFASGSESEESYLYKYKTLRSVELIYILIGIIITALCFKLSGFLANNWLNFETLDTNIIIITIILMGISIALQIIASIYSGALYGLEYQVKANIFQIIWSAAKNIGVVFVMIIIKADIITFYLWFILIDLIYLCILRISIIKILKKFTHLYWEIKDILELKKIWKFAVGIIIVSIGHALSTQIDKVIISKSFSLVELGAYNTAFNLSYIVSVFASAVGVAMFSRFTYLYSNNMENEQVSLFLNINQLLNILLITISAFISCFSFELLYVWTGSEVISGIIGNASILIIWGTTFSAMQELPYEFFLSRGITIVNNIQTIFYIIYIITVTNFLIYKFGIWGAATAWFLQMLISSAIYIMYFFKKYIGFNKLLIQYILPTIIAIMIAVSSKIIINLYIDSIYLKVTLAVLMGAITLVLQLGLYIKFNVVKLSLKGDK